MSDSLLKQEVVWIDKDETLEQAAEKWQQKKLLAVDTEFMRSRTYYPIAGLIQINDGDKNYLIDPVVINDFYPLVEVLDNPEILKILHSCSEDLEVFQHALSCMPKGLLDTQIAGAIAGHGFSVGFGNLVNTVLGVELPKSETRSDWLQRPLSQSQITYAALDVEYLYTLAETLITDLKEKQRFDWALEDSNALVENFFINQDPDRSYLRFKSAWKLSQEQLYILKALSRWREDQAQLNDVPRNRIIKDAALFGIAQKAPKGFHQLRKFEGLTERMIRNHGDKFLAIVKESQETDASELPPLQAKPPRGDERDLMDNLRALVINIAEELGMPQEVLMRKKDYEAIVVSVREGSNELPASLNGWREKVVAEPLRAYLKENPAQVSETE